MYPLAYIIIGLVFWISFVLITAEPDNMEITVMATLFGFMMAAIWPFTIILAAFVGLGYGVALLGQRFKRHIYKAD